MAETLGARLREQRERQHIALAAIAEQTKIKRSLLEELEQDSVAHWPVGIFRRAFVRAYARAIGLEPDVVVREFLELHPDPLEVVAEVPDGSAPQTRIRYLVGSALRTLSGRPEASAAETPLPVETPAAPIAKPTAPSDPDLLATAQLCTKLGQARQISEIQPLLREVARILAATGLIVWVWDQDSNALNPALCHGYSDEVLAQIPAVPRDANNATAAAFRSGQTCTVIGSDRTSGALAAPLLAPAGCVGVLAIELPHGSEHAAWIHALMTIFAAQLAGTAGQADTASRVDYRRATG